MSDAEPSSPNKTLRRSGRERKQSGNASFASQPKAGPSKKRKTAKVDDGEESDLTDIDDQEEDELEEESEEEPEEDDNASEDDFETSLPKPKKTPSKRTPSKSKAAPKSKKKSKASSDGGDGSENDSDTTPKAKKIAKGKGKTTSSAKKGKVRVRKEVDVEFDKEGMQIGADVKGDNVFFNALMSGKAMEPVIEDWVDRYEEEQDQALGELVVFLIRSSGSSAEVTPDEAVDLDGIVSTVDDLEKETSLGAYPLISKVKQFRRFHPSLSSFIALFLSNLANTPHLYSSRKSKNEPSDLIEVFQAWLYTLAASQLRSFRHTGTVVALEVMTGLCEVAAAVREDLGTVSRQREAEKKKVDKGTAGSKERLKELEKKVKEVHWKKSKLELYLNEFFNTVFVLRYRDLEPLIRTECVKQLGIWMKTLPDVYLEGAYFKYVGWMLDDVSAPTRLQTVRALSPLYQNDSNAGGLSSFTERFKKRILQMAFHDTDLSVRTTAISILNYIDRSGMLDDEKRRQVGLLIFDAEFRVRKAVAGFFEGRWKEETEEMLEEMEGVGRKGKKGGQKGGDVDEETIKERVSWKCLASMLIRFTRALDDAREGEEDARLPDQAARETAEQLKAWHDMTTKGRVASAVDSLWEKVEGLRDWEGLVKFLGLDHSGESEDGEGGGDEAWKVDEEEEASLIQVLVAGLRKARAEGDKKDDSTVPTEMTRILIRDLPALMAKYQSDVTRMADVLSIPLLMNLEMYLDLRMVPAYESLWDDLTKIFLKNSSPDVLGPTITALTHLLSTEALSNANTRKIAELDEALLASLRSAVSERDVETAAFEEEDIDSLTGNCMRIGLLFSWRNLCEAMDETDGGKQMSGWAIMLALAARGSLGYREEGKMVDHALETLGRYIFHRALSDPEDGSRQEDLIQKRSALLEKLEEFAVGTQSNTVEVVRRSSFVLLLDQHFLFMPQADHTPVEKKLNTWAVPEPLVLMMDEQTQSRCAGFIEAEIERFADDKMDQTASQEAAAADGMSDEDEDDEAWNADKGKKRKKADGKAKRTFDDDETDQAKLAQNNRFISTVSRFIMGLRLDIISTQHADIIFAYHGRFGGEYDVICKALAEELRFVACTTSRGGQVAKVVISSMEKSFEFFLDGLTVEGEPLALSKLLASGLAVHGTQFKVLKRIHPEHIINIHTSLLEWIVKKVAQANRRGNKKVIRTTLLFFKVLTPLLATVEGRDALKIKQRLDEILKKHSIEIDSKKDWDHERAYEKRLTTLMAKDDKITKNARKKLADRRGEHASDGENDRRDEDGFRIPDEPMTRRPPAVGRRPLRDDEDEEEFPEGEEGVQPKPRAKSKARTAGTYTRAGAKRKGRDDEEEEDEDVRVPDEPMGDDGDALTPASSKANGSRKRAREDGGEAEREAMDMGGDDESLLTSLGDGDGLSHRSQSLPPPPEGEGDQAAAGEHRGSSPSLTPPPEFTRAGSTVSDVSAIETSRVRKKRPKLF